MDAGKETKSPAKEAIAEKQEEYVTYTKRWFMLIIFVLYSASNSFQWIQFSIIANVIMRYYQVESFAVDWTSMIYMITYIPLIFPASYLLERKGLRWTILLGATGTCLGAWIKAFSVAPDKYWLTFIGQAVVACSQAFVLSVPAPLAATWFGPDQVSTACSVGVFGNQLGVAIGFLVPPIFVKMHDNIDEIGSELRALFYTIASFATVVLIMAILFFKAHPPTPPSAAQAKANLLAEEEPSSFVQSVKRLVTSVPYILLVVSYGMNVGIYYAISTLLNQVIVKYYPGCEEDAGRIGLLLVFAGMAGSLVCGFILDKTHKFKEVTAAVYLFSLVSMIIYTATLDQGIIVVYIVSGILGFFTTGYLPVGFELAAELTYPEPEGTSVGLLNAASQVFGIVCTTMYSTMFYSYGDKIANGIMSGMLAVGFVLTMLIKSEMKRQNAQKPRIDNRIVA